MPKFPTTAWTARLGLAAALVGPALHAEPLSQPAGRSLASESTSTPAEVATTGNDAERAGSLRIAHEKYTLANGLEVILHEDHRTPFVAVSVWYHVGAFHEPAGRTGFAHLFEHLMFQGSEHVGDDMHIGLLEQAGASVRRGMVNGTTNFDRTNYFEVVPRNELELALWLESDRMGYLGTAISQEKLDEQRKVVKNERLQSRENVPYGLADEKLWQSVFPKAHPYFGQVIGSMADLDAATIDDVRAFYDTYYAPSNATLTLAGDFDPAEAKAWIEKYFGTLPPWSKPPARNVEPPVLQGPLRVDYPEKIAKLPRVSFLWLTPRFFEEGDAELDVLAHVLSAGKVSRLQRALLHDEELAQRVVAYQRSMQNVSVFGIDVVVRDGVDPETVIAALESQLEFLRDLPPERAEIERAINAIETDRLFALQKIGGFGGKAEQLQTYNHYLGTPEFLAQDLERYRAVSSERVMAIMQAHLTPERRATLVANPSLATPPPTADAATNEEADESAPNPDSDGSTPDSPGSDA